MSLSEHDPTESNSVPSSPAEGPRLLTRRSDTGTALVQDLSSPLAQRRRRRRLIVLRVFVILLVIAIGVAAGGSLWLRHAMRVSLPQIDGTLHARGLAAPVTVTRDEHGVPSIQAATLDDLLFAQGFVTAQDRLWQMDTLRRHAAGELAELLGPSLIEHDRSQRLLQVRTTAERALAVLPVDQLRQLEAYARGVNAFIDTSADHLPLEFHLLHYKPSPWTPRDSLLVALAMYQDLSTEFPTKLMRETLSAHLAPELLSDLYPVGAWRDHPPGQVPDLTSPRPEIEQVPLDETQSRLARPSANPRDLLAARATLLPNLCDGCRAGSNNWVVAGSRTAGGLPLVSNDMHLSLSVPDIWYEASLHSTAPAPGSTEAFDVTGLTLPGTPFVIVGRNAHVAWGITNLGGDVQDLYIEHLRGSGASTEFQRADGVWTPLDHHTERIRVRGGADVTLDVMLTTHNVGTTQLPTPIITPLYPSEHRAISLAWTAYDPAAVTSPFFGVNTATDGASLAAAFAGLGGPSLNIVYADDQNHIGYHAVGRIPIRGPADHHPLALPVPSTPEGGLPPPPRDDESALAPPRSHFAVALAAYRPRRRTAGPRQLPQPAPAENIPAPPPALGYTIGSAIPAVPVDALDPNAQWSGYILYAELPSATDPAGGVLATANARIAPDGYPYAIALDWAPPYRVDRILHLLSDASGLTPADMLRVQMDVHSEFDLALAHRIAYALDQSALKSPGVNSPATKRLRQAADILRRWNGNVDADAAAPAIVAATRTELWPMLLAPQIAAHDRAAGTAHSDIKPEGIARLYVWEEQSYALEQLLLHTPARWLPPGIANWNDLLTTALDHALDRAHTPNDLSSWSYGSTHPTEITHPLLSGFPLLAPLLGIAAGSGPHQIGGDSSTIKASARAFGPTERFTADLGNADATTSNLTTGQSGNPASPWYLDQLPHWLAGTTLPLPLHHAVVSHTLVLQP